MRQCFLLLVKYRSAEIANLHWNDNIFCGHSVAHKEALCGGAEVSSSYLAVDVFFISENLGHGLLNCSSFSCSLDVIPLVDSFWSGQWWAALSWFCHDDFQCYGRATRLLGFFAGGVHSCCWNPSFKCLLGFPELADSIGTDLNTLLAVELSFVIPRLEGDGKVTTWWWSSLSCHCIGWMVWIVNLTDGVKAVRVPSSYSFYLV